MDGELQDKQQHQGGRGGLTSIALVVALFMSTTRSCIQSSSFLVPATSPTNPSNNVGWTSNDEESYYYSRDMCLAFAAAATRCAHDVRVDSPLSATNTTADRSRSIATKIAERHGDELHACGHSHTPSGSCGCDCQSAVNTKEETGGFAAERLSTGRRGAPIDDAQGRPCRPASHRDVLYRDGAEEGQIAPGTRGCPFKGRSLKDLRCVEANNHSVISTCGGQGVADRSKEGATMHGETCKDERYAGGGGDVDRSFVSSWSKIQSAVWHINACHCVLLGLHSSNDRAFEASCTDRAMVRGTAVLDPLRLRPALALETYRRRCQLRRNHQRSSPWLGRDPDRKGVLASATDNNRVTHNRLERPHDNSAAKQEHPPHDQDCRPGHCIHLAQGEIEREVSVSRQRQRRRTEADVRGCQRPKRDVREQEEQLLNPYWAMVEGCKGKCAWARRFQAAIEAAGIVL